MKTTGAQMVVRALEAEGVEFVFGIPGGAVIPLYDALGDARFKVILTRHEQAACHAADGYARASGKTGVCIATSGPGATNLVTGLANAHMDSVPLVAITGQVNSGAIGTDAFQEADIYGSSLPLVKHSFLVRSIEELPSALRGAFIIASTGRPGPVLVDVPVDVQRAEGEFDYPPQVNFPGYHPEKRLDISHMDEAVEALAAATRPVILAGGGCAFGGGERNLQELAESNNIPVATTLMGKGAFPESNRLSLGMIGMHGSPQANLAVSRCDVLLAAGTRFSDRCTGDRARFARGARIIHIDIDAAELNKNVEVAVALHGEAGQLLGILKERLAGQEYPDREPWISEIDEIRSTWPVAAPASSDGQLSTPGIIRRVRERLPRGNVLTTEVGQHQMWAALHWQCERPRNFITSGGLGTMGFGLPAAIGAAFARKGEPVVCLAGDGSLMMNLQELETCGRYGLPLRIIVLNNGSLGMVRQWQEMFWNERYVHTCERSICPFTELAGHFGIEAFAASSEAELEKALDGAFAARGPSLVECAAPTKENVLPMVPPGEALESFIYSVDPCACGGKNQ